MLAAKWLDLAFQLFHHQFMPNLDMPLLFFSVALRFCSVRRRRKNKVKMVQDCFRLRPLLPRFVFAYANSCPGLHLLTPILAQVCICLCQFLPGFAFAYANSCPGLLLLLPILAWVCFCLCQFLPGFAFAYANSCPGLLLLMPILAQVCFCLCQFLPRPAFGLGFAKARTCTATLTEAAAASSSCLLFHHVQPRRKQCCCGFVAYCSSNVRSVYPYRRKSYTHNQKA